MISQLLGMATSTEASKHLSVGITIVGGEIYVNPYLYMTIL